MMVNAVCVSVTAAASVDDVHCGALESDAMGLAPGGCVGGWSAMCCGHKHE